METPVHQTLRTLVDAARPELPDRTVVVVFASVPRPTGGSNLFYLSNGDRGDVITVLRQYLAAHDSRN